MSNRKTIPGSVNTEMFFDKLFCIFDFAYVKGQGHRVIRDLNVLKE